MKKSKLINYWDKTYSSNLIVKESSFARFTYKRIKKIKKNKILDIGCGGGRDCFYFYKKKFNVTGIDISKKAIKKNSQKKTKNLNFKIFDIGKDKIIDKFEIIYCRFFLHAIDEKLENKLIKLITKVSKKNSLIFFEFRNNKDKIFKNSKKIKHNDVIEFEKGHYRRVIDPRVFKKKFIQTTKSNILYQKSSKNLSIVKNDNPHLTRMVFKA